MPDARPDDRDDTAGRRQSLRVQTVLYRPASGDIGRLLRGLGMAVAHLLRESHDLSVVMVFGDSSPTPSLTLDEIAAWDTSMKEFGIDALSYEYFGKNLGSARGQNRLMHESSEDFVMFLNPDAYLSPFCLAELMILMSDSSVGMAEGRQIPLEHPKAFDPDSGDTSWASTACAVVRRSVIDAITGFDDESFFLYCDDVDFSWRTRLNGFRVVHQPTAMVFHDKRLTNEGKMRVGDAEHYYSAEAAMMLAWKYSRPDLAEEWAAGYEKSPMALHRKAATAFRERQVAGTLPTPLDPDGQVAEFIGFEFAEHRFSYDDD
jgi:GT2 family glycosyltransferase